MDLSVEQLIAEAGQMALELRLKDRLITAQQARLATMEAEAVVLRAEVSELADELRMTDKAQA